MRWSHGVGEHSVQIHGREHGRERAKRADEHELGLAVASSASKMPLTVFGAATSGVPARMRVAGPAGGARGVQVLDVKHGRGTASRAATNAR